MKTISIGTQSSAAALAQAFADALATEIGWRADDEGNVKKDGIDIYFRFYVSGASVQCTISNSYTSPSSSTTVSFSTANTYNIYIMESTGGSIAVGIGVSTGIPYFGVLITRNTAGVYIGISIYSNSIYTVRGVETSNRQISLSTSNSSSGVSTSIVKMPDIWGAAMFNDLYYVMSCPYKSTDRVFYIGGKNYRSVGPSDNYMYFALPEE
ncbi:MAG: hypothetical protein K2N06_05530 [Oscillospiraceae bacterium]|nr:hypothetical protein [Oscillospiraceae bacterium]